MNKTFFLLIFISVILCSDSSYSQTIVTGKASYYADRFHGRKTASGEKYLKHLLTAAHPSLPFGTIVTVRNPKNGKSVEVKINDRGPFSQKRIIDLSREAARQLEILTIGIADVELEYDLPLNTSRQQNVKHLEKLGPVNDQKLYTIDYLSVKKISIVLPKPIR